MNQIGYRLSRFGWACVVAVSALACSGEPSGTDPVRQGPSEELGQRQQGLGICSAVTLTLSPPSPQEVGVPVTLSAEAAGCTKPRYLFQMRSRNEFGEWGAWTKISKGIADHVTVYELAATQYQFRVKAKDKTATAWESTAKRNFNFTGQCHDACETGLPMEPSCEGAGDVCAADPYCCTYAWDEECKALVQPACVIPEMIVFGDHNPFDQTRMTNPSNVTMVKNLVNFIGPGSRGLGSVVQMDLGHFPACAPSCGSPFVTMYTAITNLGFTVEETVAPLTGFDPDVKVVFLWTPTLAYTVDEINALKAFAAEGGRIVLVAEYDALYGPAGFEVANTLLWVMGSEMTVAGGAFDCPSELIPPTALGTHQVNVDMTDVRVACSSRLSLGALDDVIYQNSTESVVLSGATLINTVPITEIPPILVP